MPEFVKKPVRVRAEKFDGSLDRANEIAGIWPVCVPEFTDDAARKGFTGSLLILTLEGRMRASAGDYIIQGVKGEVYPCKPDIFEQTYDPVPTPVTVPA